MLLSGGSGSPEICRTGKSSQRGRAPWCPRAMGPGEEAAFSPAGFHDTQHNPPDQDAVQTSVRQRARRLDRDVWAGLFVVTPGGTLFQRPVSQPLCLSYRGETDAPSLSDAGDCQGSVDRDSGRPGRGVLPGPWGFPEDAQHSRPLLLCVPLYAF